MATIQIENVPSELYDRLQNLTPEHKLTVNETFIDLLQQALHLNESAIAQEQSTNQMVKVLHNICSRSRLNPVDYGVTDSTILIQDDRNR